MNITYWEYVHVLLCVVLAVTIALMHYGYRCNGCWGGNNFILFSEFQHGAVHFIAHGITPTLSLVPRPLPTRVEGPGTHRLHMCHFIRRFSVKLSVYYNLPRGNSIACSNRYQGKSFCFCWPANCSNKLFELASCVSWPYASRKIGWRNLKYLVYWIFYGNIRCTQILGTNWRMRSRCVPGPSPRVGRGLGTRLSDLIWVHEQN